MKADNAPEDEIIEFIETATGLEFPEKKHQPIHESNLGAIER